MKETQYQPYVLPALLALLLFGFLIILVTSGSGGSGSSQPANGSLRNEAPDPSSDKSTKAVTVRVGDTPTAIADRAGMSVNQLLELNPNLDPRTLRPGQKLKLSR
jgi:LysM repeat protein